MIDPNDMAFPSNSVGFERCEDGLSKQEYAAIHIMAGLPESIRSDEAARIAVQRTKSLFAQLNREEK